MSFLAVYWLQNNVVNQPHATILHCNSQEGRLLANHRNGLQIHCVHDLRLRAFVTGTGMKDPPFMADMHRQQTKAENPIAS